MDKQIDPRKIRFSIIKHFNSPNSAVTLDGYTVRRQNKIFIRELGRSVVCAPYDNHFIYLDPVFNQKGGRWFAMCTCGSPAVIAGYNAYKKDASPTSGDDILPGEMLVCYFHSNTGRHSDGST
jgi:hypothetical protein